MVLMLRWELFRVYEKRDNSFELFHVLIAFKHPFYVPFELGIAPNGSHIASDV